MRGDMVRKVRRSAIDRLPDYAAVNLMYCATFRRLPNLRRPRGTQFDFVRVDLYSPPQGIFFGEVAFYPNAGLQAFTPKEWDNKFGEPWKI
jgi:hypothetical protein